MIALYSVKVFFSLVASFCFFLLFLLLFLALIFRGLFCSFSFSHSEGDMKIVKHSEEIEVLCQ